VSLVILLFCTFNVKYELTGQSADVNRKKCCCSLWGEIKLICNLNSKLI
jgi:hypothetical protein